MANAAWALKPPAHHTAPAYEHTFGPQVARLCEQVGFAPDPEQRVILDDLFAVDETGMSASFETAVIAPRQQLKTGLMKQAAIGWSMVTQAELITWSAHLFSTTEEAFRDLSVMMTNSPLLRRRLAPGPTNGIHSARGSEHIEFRDGRRILFRSRTKTGGRGLTGDKIILDEAFALQDEHLGALIPTLTAVPDPQILYGSSAGLAYSAILREIRDRGRAGSPGLAYTEYAAPFRRCADPRCEHRKPSHPLHQPGCALDDEELWAIASPLLGRRRANGTGLTLAKMRKFRESEPPSEWMRERIGWWEDPGTAEVFGPGRWELCGGVRPAGALVKALGVQVSIDGDRASIVAGASHGDRIVVKPLRHGHGVDWIRPALVELRQRHRGAKVLIDGHGPGAELVPTLKQFRPHVLTTSEALDACAQLKTMVVTGRLLHTNSTVLDGAAGGAIPRDVGDRWLWGRRKSTSDITALEAATWAAWWVARPPSTPPPPELPRAIEPDGGIEEVNVQTMGF